MLTEKYRLIEFVSSSECSAFKRLLWMGYLTSRGKNISSEVYMADVTGKLLNLLLLCKMSYLTRWL